MQIMYLLLILLIPNVRHRIRRMKMILRNSKNTAYTASKISYTGIVDFRNAAKIATPA
jgi:hypothetical protein